eukprot:6078041-Pyramimonas_sp.AAC.1
MGNYGKNGYHDRQQFVLVLNRARCRCRRGRCPFETDGRLPNCGRCRFWSLAHPKLLVDCPGARDQGRPQGAMLLVLH